MDIIISTQQAFELGFFFTVGSSVCGLVVGGIALMFNGLFG